LPRGWIALAVIAAAVVLVLILVSGGDDEPAPVIRSPGPSSGPAVATRLVLAVTGGREPSVAVIGSGGGVAPAALVLPADTTIVVPGAGELTVAQVASLPLGDLQVGISNGVGAWAAEAARLDLADLAAAIGGVGGLEVNLPAQVMLGGETLGPGPASLDAAQVEQLLAQRSDDTELRWRSALAALLAQPELWPVASAESTDPDAVASILEGARGVEPQLAPTEVVAGTLRVPSQPTFDETVQELFGTEPPVPVEVLNGTGTPGIGSTVGAAIVPEGFRIVLSGNAETFDVLRTEIIANGPDAEADAQRIRGALGVGAVRVSQVPSGIADVTVIIGADLTP
jgi:hypothetical protein